MSFMEPRGEHVLFGQVPPLAVHEAEAVRDLAMTHVREQARTVRVSATDEARAHRFVLYDNSGGVVGSGLTDTLLSVSVAKKAPRHQSLRISFLELILTHNNRYSNYREIYAFDWYGESVIAHKTNIELLGEFTVRIDEETGNRVDLVTPRKTISVLPVEPGDCDELCDRMIAVTETIRQKVAA